MSGRTYHEVAPAGCAPSHDQQAEDKTNPEQKSFTWITPAIDHGCKEQKGNQLACGLVDHRKNFARIFLNASYANSKATPIMAPLSMICSIIDTSFKVSALTMSVKG